MFCGHHELGPNWGFHGSNFWRITIPLLATLSSKSIRTQSLRQKERLNYSTGATNGNRIGVLGSHQRRQCKKKKFSGPSMSIIKSVRLAMKGMKR